VKVGIVIFPGSNCDFDAYQAFKLVDGVEVSYIWHGAQDISNFDLIVLPGGFSFGDYLRSGAVARFSPVMNSVIEFAAGGGHLLGICNGFQTLLESGLLPGAMLRNSGLRFVCKDVYLRVENNLSCFTGSLENGDLLKMPIAHGEGNYYADNKTLKELEENDRIIFRYADGAGAITANSNPNGSLNNIAGIINEKGNVLGMMPHPERAVEKILGSQDGLKLVKSISNIFSGGKIEK
jgi:phosphoribosylformylglycinamidine synthase I